MPLSSHSVFIWYSWLFLCGNETDTVAFPCGEGAIFLHHSMDETLYWLLCYMWCWPLSPSGHTYSSCARQFPRRDEWMTVMIFALVGPLSVCHCIGTPVKCTSSHLHKTPFWWLLCIVSYNDNLDTLSRCSFSCVGSHPTYNALFCRIRIPLTL